jgi:hypothetical protein
LTEQAQPAGSGPAGPDEDSETASPTPRRRRNFRGAQLGAALTSRSAGWIVAAALAGSLATYLFAPPRTSSPASVGVAYQSAAPGAVQRSARIVRPGGQAGVQVPAYVPGPTGVAGLPQRQITAGRVEVVLPPGGPAAGQIVAGPGGNWVGAPMPGCAFPGPGGLPGGRVSVRVGRPGAMRRFVSVHGRRATIGLAPVPQRVVIVRPPLARRIVVRNGHSVHVRIVRLGGARRVVVVRPGRRSVRAPRQVRLWLRSGKHLTVVPGALVPPMPGPGTACVIIRPPR